MKAIETTYRGWKFRSRLEARWAVFFDALRIAWEYEPEGFEFADGERYLPDFFLPGFCIGGIYVEVKPFEQAFEKAHKFSREGKKSILLAHGTPSWGAYTFLKHTGDELIDCSAAFKSKYLPGGINAREYRLYISPETCDPNHYAVNHAIVAARSARFEFGELERGL